MPRWGHPLQRAFFLGCLWWLFAAVPALASSGGTLAQPSAHDRLTGVVAVEGTAAHPTFRKWQLDLLIDGKESAATFLALGEEPIPSPAQMHRLDTARYPNGSHLLRLRVVHSNLNYNEIFVPVTFDNPVAPGHPASAEDKPAAEPPAAKELPPLAVFRTDAPAEGERWIEVDLSEQRLTAWQGDVAVYETIVSTGKTSTRTLTGEFAVYWMLEKTRMRGPGYDTPDVPWTLFYDGDFAIHGAYWHNNFGTPVSHGCINLRVPEAQALYRWASIGTRVVVHE